MKYIIDTDPGIDDALAIMMAKINKLDIIGFTLASGNVDIKKSDNNLKYIEDYLNINIPIFWGRKVHKASLRGIPAHGIDGFGYIPLPKSKRITSSTYAEDFIIKASKKYKNNLTIICIGAHTNLSEAIKKDPSLKKRISKVILMGASDNNYNEFNVSIDPKATQSIINSGIENIYVITHEMGLKAVIKSKYLNDLQLSQTLTSRLAGCLCQKYIDFNRAKYDIDGISSPDPLCIAYEIDNSIVKFKKANIDVDLQIPGNTYIKYTKNGNINVSYSINSKKFEELFKQTFH